MLPPSRSSRFRRRAYFGIGWFFFGLGALGAFLPVLPTTPLMIIALWAFSQSSEKFEQWLYNHAVFGPPLQRWHRFRVISVPAKVASVGAMAASIVYRSPAMRLISFWVPGVMTAWWFWLLPPMLTEEPK